MSLKDCPCRGCTERILLCHGRCDRYQKWKAEYETAKQNFESANIRPDFPKGMLRYVYQRMKEGRRNR
jgi:hypothetical protein